VRQDIPGSKAVELRKEIVNQPLLLNNLKFSQSPITPAPGPLPLKMLQVRGLARLC